jgi:hypothetical protein
MFEFQKLLGNTERKIALETRLGTPIRNAIDPPPRPDQIQKFARLCEKYPQWRQRVGPVGGYNCLGHVWASRRTGIYDDVEGQIDLIFRDDGFRVLSVNESPLPGDLVAYWTAQADRRLFLHVGMILELRGAEGTEISIPFVLSKFDATFGEVVHHFRHVPYPEAFQTQIEFWTERPSL